MHISNADNILLFFQLFQKLLISLPYLDLAQKYIEKSTNKLSTGPMVLEIEFDPETLSSQLFQQILSSLPYLDSAQKIH